LIRRFSFYKNRKSTEKLEDNIEAAGLLEWITPCCRLFLLDIADEQLDVRETTLGKRQHDEEGLSLSKSLTPHRSLVPPRIQAQQLNKSTSSPQWQRLRLPTLPSPRTRLLCLLISRLRHHPLQPLKRLRKSRNLVYRGTGWW
jgi:hypothetical protein